MQWRLIFVADDGTSPQVFCANGNPQEAAQQCLGTLPAGFVLVAALHADGELLLADDNRRAECGLQGWAGG